MVAWMSWMVEGRSTTELPKSDETDHAVVLEFGATGDWSQAEPFRPGVGITGMRERVKDLGGVLEIVSGQMGSHVKAIIPLASRSQKAAPDRNVSVGSHS